MASSPLVIIGTGLAGYTLAREWRRLDHDRPLVMLTADDGSFYSKPMLSNALAQNKTAEALAVKTATAMARELDADIRSHVVVSGIDTTAHTVSTDGGALDYGDLVLAMGAEPIHIPMDGDGAAGMLSVNDLDDYRRFRKRLENARSVAVMGPGLIGCEFANDMVTQGLDVEVFGPDQWPLSTLLPEAAGRALQGALEAAGIRFHLGTTATRIDRTDDGYRVTLGNGTQLTADLVLSAVGLRPNTSLAQATGLKVGRGIVTDRFLRTSDSRVYALGDCAEVAGLNLPFVMPIMHAARALAKTLAGETTEVAYPPMPVVIKTPALATAVSPPPRGAKGEWKITGCDSDIRATFESADSQLLGFALTGKATTEKQALTQKLPPVL